jgi:hypothetical protein
VNLSDPTGLCVGEKYNADKTTCVLDMISMDRSPWFDSMIDAVFGLSGRPHALAGMTLARNDDGRGSTLFERVGDVAKEAGQCALDHYGLGAILGAGGTVMVAAGAPVLPYPRSGVDAASSTGRTSLLSRAARHIPGEFTQRRLAPTLKNLGATTMSKGAFFARWVPWIGGAMLAVDAAFITACVVSS